MNGSFFAADFPAGGFCGFLAKEMKGKTRDSSVKLEMRSPHFLPRRLYGPNKSRGEFLDDTIKSGNSGFSDSENYPIFFTSGIVGKGGYRREENSGKKGYASVDDDDEDDDDDDDNDDEDDEDGSDGGIQEKRAFKIER
ncbi:hypothetical protein HZH68_008175 [Vespula germanica]|uniref:Uncharacterized protein n=1 Tax=Vespula germanica TaxID=30212 RepID=A0A834K3Q7_VESGE|nr:hypothetical protein HZH68_008175 [Vespula germanica]